MSITGFWVFRIRRIWWLVVPVVMFTGFFLWQQQIAVNTMAVVPVLRNRIIVIDAGHGGIDPGAIGKQGTLEKDITLKVARQLGYVLSQAGAEVILTRDSDTDLSDPDLRGPSAKKRQDLRRRVELANGEGAEAYVSIHVNSFPSSKFSGAQAFYQVGQPGGEILAKAIQEELRRVLQNTDRVAKGMNLYINRKTSMPSVTVEIGFISNPNEELLMKNPEYQNKVVWAVFMGLVDYFSRQQEVPGA